MSFYLKEERSRVSFAKRAENFLEVLPFRGQLVIWNQARKRRSGSLLAAAQQSHQPNRV